MWGAKYFCLYRHVKRKSDCFIWPGRECESGLNSVKGHRPFKTKGECCLPADWTKFSQGLNQPAKLTFFFFFFLSGGVIGEKFIKWKCTSVFVSPFKASGKCQTLQAGPLVLKQLNNRRWATLQAFGNSINYLRLSSCWSHLVIVLKGLKKKKKKNLCAWLRLCLTSRCFTPMTDKVDKPDLPQMMRERKCSVCKHTHRKHTRLWMKRCNRSVSSDREPYGWVMQMQPPPGGAWTHLFRSLSLVSDRYRWR